MITVGLLDEVMVNGAGIIYRGQAYKSTGL